MTARASRSSSLMTTEFVISRQGRILFEDIALNSGPVMHWRGGEQHGNFVVESDQIVPDVRGERLTISGSDGSCRTITVTDIVDNVIYFRSGDPVDL